MSVKWCAAIPLIFSCAFGTPAPPAGSSDGAATTTDRGWSDLTTSMEKMHHAMASVAPSGDTDVDFARLMLPHHRAAIDMAKTELLFGKSPELRRLAQEIITDQQSEIDVMELWLQKHAPGQQKTRKPSDTSVKEN